ncbi:MAG: hypothetical protein ACRDHS_08765 [Actinomycetota bacterium]
MAFLLALGLGLILTPVARQAGFTMGFVDRLPGSSRLKIHDRPVPVLGGVAVIASVLGTAAVLGQFEGLAAVALLLALAVGHTDDLRSLPPWLRVVGILSAGGLLALGGMRLEPVGPFGAVVVPLLALTCANAVNLVDGQDGLAGGTAACAALGLAGVGAVGGGTGAMSAELALGGALVAFLAWNLPPARIFLGNGGAYAVGVALAAGACGASARGWSALLAAAVSLAVFAFEFTLTVVRRLASRSPLTRGDRAHSYDILADRLGSRGRSTAAFVLAGAVCAGLAPAVAAVPIDWAAAAVVATAVGAAVFGAWVVRESKGGAWTPS